MVALVPLCIACKLVMSSNVLMYVDIKQDISSCFSSLPLLDVVIVYNIIHMPVPDTCDKGNVDDSQEVLPWRFF